MDNVPKKPVTRKKTPAELIKAKIPAVSANDFCLDAIDKMMPIIADLTSHAVRERQRAGMTETLTFLNLKMMNLIVQWMAAITTVQSVAARKKIAPQFAVIQAGLLALRSEIEATIASEAKDNKTEGA